MSYGIIFWGNSPYSSEIFQMQERAIRKKMGCAYTESCRELFKELKILALSSQYIFSLLLLLLLIMHTIAIIPDKEMIYISLE
jgi:hypothetical protein